MVEEVIVEIFDTNTQPVPQKGEVVKFIRRKPKDGDWSGVKSLDDVYDYIRMLDAEGYPPALVRIDDYKLEISRAHRKIGAVDANVKITRETRNE